MIKYFIKTFNEDTVHGKIVESHGVTCFVYFGVKPIKRWTSHMVNTVGDQTTISFLYS